jgi:hypothetical protein
MATYEQLVGVAAIDDGQQLLSPLLILVAVRHSQQSEITPMSERVPRTSKREFYTFFSLGVRVYNSSPQCNQDP